MVQYLQSLPKYFHNLICWSDQQLALLRNKQLEKKIKSRKEEYRAAYEQIVGFMEVNEKNALERIKVSKESNEARSTRGCRRTRMASRLAPDLLNFH